MISPKRRLVRYCSKASRCWPSTLFLPHDDRSRAPRRNSRRSRTQPQSPRPIGLRASRPPYDAHQACNAFDPSKRSGTPYRPKTCRTARPSSSLVCIWCMKSRARKRSTCCARGAGRSRFPAGRSRRSITSCRRAIRGPFMDVMAEDMLSASNATAARPAIRSSTSTAGSRASST